MNIRTGGFIGLETKFLDMAKTATTIDDDVNLATAEMDPTGTGCTGCLSAPAQNATESGRIGRKITIKSLQIEGVLSVASQLNQTDADPSPIVFIALVLDKQTNGAQFNSENVYTSPGATELLSASPLRNMEYTNRFRVLKNKQVTFQQAPHVWDGTNIEVGGQTKPFRFFVEFPRGLPVQFNSGTTANVSAVIDNSLHLMATVNNLGYAVNLLYNARLRYVDN
jgi:hypothetical protein